MNHTYRKLCPKPKFCFKVLIRCHGRLETTKNLSLRMSWNYQNSLLQAPLIKIQVIWDFYEQTEYILIMIFYLVRWCI